MLPLLSVIFTEYVPASSDVTFSNERVLEEVFTLLVTKAFPSLNHWYDKSPSPTASTESCPLSPSISDKEAG